MQRSVSLSSAEAKYFGGMMAARDVMFLRDLLLDLGIYYRRRAFRHPDDPVGLQVCHRHVVGSGGLQED